MATTVQKVYRFVVALADAHEITDGLDDAALGAGCDDALLWERESRVYLTFGREADSLGSAIADVERAGFAVARVEVGG